MVGDSNGPNSVKGKHPMTGASKILTVSYGTFSCTLEGFDEPFNTMKAIAEYFRDLAADDRYFGAEPPTPDAAMLHRIAEREIHRKVEARIEDNSVILRAGDWVPGAGPAAAAVAGAALDAASEDQAEVMSADERADALPEDADALPEDFVEDLAVEAEAEAIAVEAEVEADDLSEAFFAQMVEPEPAFVAKPPQLADSMPEGVAAKLARLRQSVATTGPAAAVMPEHFEDEHAAAAPVADDLTEVFATVVEDAGEVEVAAAVVVEAEAEVTVEAEAKAEPEDDAGMLARLGGLLVDENEVAGSVEPEMEDAASDAMADLAAALDTEVPHMQTPHTQTPHTQTHDMQVDDDLAGLIATMAGGDAGDKPAEAVPTAVVQGIGDAVNPFAEEADFDDDDEVYDLADEPTLPELPELEGDLNDDLPAGLLGDLPEGLLADLPDYAAEVEVEDLAATLIEEAKADPSAAEAVQDEIAPEAEAVTEPEAETVIAEKARRARARVIKIRRADALPVADPEAEVSAEPAPRARAVVAPEEGGDDLARLLRQTDEEMSEPENQRRQSAIQHLKKAVAATVAERRAGVKEPSDEERADPYRDDLAQAVSPVRPRAVEGRVLPQRPVARNVERAAERPVAEPVSVAPEAAIAASDRPAPLMLVSEQRIDRTAPARVAPVRPRRMGGSGGAATAAVAATAFEQAADAGLEAELEAALHKSSYGDDSNDIDDLNDEDDDEEGDAADAENIFASSKGFAEFADRLGASGLPDLLEAAAAYATCVENREHFTRPLLMRRLENGELGGQMSREDGLRSFGTLLREGRIEKIRRGHYALPEDSNMLAKARKMAR